MSSARTLIRHYLSPLALLALWWPATGCAAPQADAVRERLADYIDTIEVVDTHEHQRWVPQDDARDINFYTILAGSYLQADLVSAGAPPLRREEVGGGDLEALWDTYGPALDFARATSYYGQFLAGFRQLYGYDAPYFTKEGIQSLSEQIRANYQDRDRWYAEAFDRAGFQIMLVDQYWAPFNLDLDPRYFALVFNVNNVATAVTQRTIRYREDAPPSVNLYRLAEEEGFSIQTLEDYLAFVDHLFLMFKDHDVVALKNSMAYGRSLDYVDIPYERAAALFSHESSSLSPDDQKALTDFVFHRIIEKSIEYDLPIQIHTGYLAGNGNTLEHSHPLKLNNLFLKYPRARFSLFHGGYPWVGEFAALGKMFPNVYLDLVWLPQISRQAAVRGLDEILDTVPYNKIFWGGDCHSIEESTGSLEFGKDVVAEVLAGRVERGLMSEEVARDVARKIFRDNAIRFFKLQGELHIAG